MISELTAQCQMAGTPSKCVAEDSRVGLFLRLRQLQQTPNRRPLRPSEHPRCVRTPREDDNKCRDSQHEHYFIRALREVACALRGALSRLLTDSVSSSGPTDRQAERFRFTCQCLQDSSFEHWPLNANPARPVLGWHTTFALNLPKGEISSQR